MPDDVAVVEYSAVLFDLHPLPMAVWDAQTLRYVAVNDAALAAFRYTREEFLRLTPLELRSAEEGERLVAWLRTRDADESASFRQTGTWELRASDGTTLDVEIAVSRRFDFQGRPAYLVTYLDKGERDRALEDSRTKSVLLETADEMARIGTFRLDLRSQAYESSGEFGRRATGEHGILALAAWLRAAMPEDQRASVEAFLDGLRRHEPHEARFAVNIDGKLRWYHSRTRVIRDEAGVPTHVVGVTTDITDHRTLVDQLLAAAHRDVQTGLPNRSALHADTYSTAATGMLLLRVKWSSAALVAEDARSAAAKAVTEVLRELMSSDATLLRYADDVYCVITTAKPRALRALAKRIVVRFERPLNVMSSEVAAVPTVGMAFGGSEGKDRVTLSGEAEVALEQAQLETTRIAEYDDTFAAARIRRALIDRNLRHAIAQRTVGVAYQPIVSLSTGKIVGAEALMRWVCPGVGPVPPAEFIPIAEESGLIVKLGDWILREACAQARRWHVAGHALRISVNVSARQVQEPDFLRLVLSICEQTSLDPSHLELELTESTMMHGLALRNLQALRRRGVRVAIDDFGTGYSSLSYLSTLPLDTVKVDRSFVVAMQTDEFQADVTRSVVALAHRRGLEVVGEGVETAEQTAALRTISCDLAQGFLFGHPATALDFAGLLERERLVTSFQWNVVSEAG